MKKCDILIFYWNKKGIKPDLIMLVILFDKCRNHLCFEKLVKQLVFLTPHPDSKVACSLYESEDAPPKAEMHVDGQVC